MRITQKGKYGHIQKLYLPRREENFAPTIDKERGFVYNYEDGKGAAETPFAARLQRYTSGLHNIALKGAFYDDTPR